MTQCVFLSSPYSHPNESISEDRVTAAGNACVWLYRQGYQPMSPIAHWHRIAQRHDLPTEAMAWTDWNRQWVYASDAVVVLELNGFHHRYPCKLFIISAAWGLSFTARPGCVGSAQTARSRSPMSRPPAWSAPITSSLPAEAALSIEAM